MKYWKMNQGITLLELILSISIIGIIATFSVPNFNTMVNHSKVNSEAEQLFEFVRLAKTEAVKRNVSVELFYEIDSNNNHCIGMRKQGDSDSCELASSNYPRFIFDNSHHYNIKTVNAGGGVVNLSEGILVAFNPTTGKSTNSRRVLVNSTSDPNFVSGVRITDVGFIFPCSSLTHGGKSLCV